MSEQNYTHARVSKKTMAKAKKIVEVSVEYRSVAHLMDVLTDREAKKLGVKA